MIELQAAAVTYDRTNIANSIADSIVVRVDQPESYYTDRKYHSQEHYNRGNDRYERTSDRTNSRANERSLFNRPQHRDFKSNDNWRNRK